MCKKVFQNKRKAFNSKNKRIIDSEHAMLLKHAEKEEKKKEKMGLNGKLKETVSKKVPKWKMQSEQFRHNIQSMKTGEDDNPPKYDSKEYDGYTHCELCNRRYNEDAYKKHLTYCQNKYQKESSKKNNINSNNKGVTVKNGGKPNLNVKFRR